MSFAEAIDLVDELERNVGSHYMASVNNWSLVAGYGELMTALHLGAFVNSHRTEKQGPADVMLPWTVAKPAEQVSKAERDYLREQLLKRSAFQN